MSGDEMVEKAREHYDSLPEETKYKWAGEVKPHWAFEFAASFSRSAVRDAVRECYRAFFLPYLSTPDSQGVCAACHHHCPSIDDMVHFEGCVASALRKKFEVE